MTSATQIIGYIKNTLEQREIAFLCSGDFSVSANFVINEKIPPVKVIITAVENGFCVECLFLYRVSEDRKSNAAEYIIRVNSGLQYGRLDLNYDTGTIRAYVYVDCEECDNISPDKIYVNILRCLSLCGKHNNKLKKIIYGFSTPSKELGVLEPKM